MFLTPRAALNNMPPPDIISMTFSVLLSLINPLLTSLIACETVQEITGGQSNEDGHLPKRSSHCQLLPTSRPSLSLSERSRITVVDEESGLLEFSPVTKEGQVNKLRACGTKKPLSWNLGRLLASLLRRLQLRIPLRLLYQSTSDTGDYVRVVKKNDLYYLRLIGRLGITMDKDCTSSVK